MRSLAVVIAIGVACDAAPAPSVAAPPASASPSPAPSPAKATALPPAPEGAVVVGDLYVLTCAAAGSCPAMLQVAGAAHCKALTLGGLSWRLPTRDELERLPGRAELSALDGFHWSGTPYDDAPGQVWIFDPTSGSKTTIPPDRKPFTVRCVAQPPS